MGKKSKVLNGLSYRLLLEYLKDSSQSDGQLAKTLGVSQSTVTVLKNKLLNEGVIEDFTIIPNLAKMGYEILVFSFAKFNMDQIANIERGTEKWVKKRPEILFSSRAQGMGMDAVTISIHKDYAEYMAFYRENRTKGLHFMKDMKFLLVDLRGNIAKPFSFKYLVDDGSIDD